jgi:putative tricarboxylic transport membrane protein
VFFTKRRIGGLLLLAFCIAYAYLSQRIPLLPIQARAAFNASTMPEALAAISIVLCLAIIILPTEEEPLDLRGQKWGMTIAFLVLMSFYGLTIRPFGFILSSSILLGVGYWILGERKWWLLLITSVPVAFGFWALMTLGLGVYLDPLPWFLRG